MLGIAVGAGLAARFQIGRARVESEWRDALPGHLDDFGTVSRLRIVPLVDAEAAEDRLMTEPGVSYLVIADELRILFDLGLNAGRRWPLVENAIYLGIDLSLIDLVVISHAHPDHVGGIRAAARRTLHVPDAVLSATSAKAVTPVPISHPQLRCEHAASPTVLAAGVATSGTISRALFFFGRTPEHALLVNVQGKGLVVIVGCGHQGVPRLLKRVEALSSSPIHGVVGGLHLPVHGLLAQDIIGTANWPWQRTEESVVESTIAALERRTPKLVALSPHDSSRWTVDRFTEAFGDRYRTILVGEEIRVDAPVESSRRGQRPTRTTSGPGSSARSDVAGAVAIADAGPGVLPMTAGGLSPAIRRTG
jgi:7,8-dihydropterin-6-yl-methyl-4-(beta-D-ribofuranosyl)aminobenzene 5'-phosphate synthase